MEEEEKGEGLVEEEEGEGLVRYNGLPKEEKRWRALTIHPHQPENIICPISTSTDLHEPNTLIHPHTLSYTLSRRQQPRTHPTFAHTLSEHEQKRRYAQPDKHAFFTTAHQSFLPARRRFRFH